MGGPNNLDSVQFSSMKMDYPYEDKTMMMMKAVAMHEETPHFREAQTMPHMQHKPEHLTVMSRGDSSSTASSTVSATSPISDFPKKKNYDDVVVERPCYQWLCELQSRIYSREQEEALLQKKYLDWKQSSSPSKKGGYAAELCLISGPGGVGKTRLARTLESRVQEDDGYFIATKFQQFTKSMPTGCLADAMAQLTNAILEKEEHFVLATKRAIKEAVGDEMGLLISAVPCLEKLVGRHIGEPVQMNCHLIDRLVFALHDLFNAISAAGNPIVFLIDDLQWGSPCNLKVLRMLVSCNQNENLFFMATCCEEDVTHSSPAAVMLRELEDKNNCQIFNIALQQKPGAVVKQLVKEVLPMPQERLDAMAGLVCHQTRGNPLYVIEFIRWLHQEHFLFYNESEKMWTFHDDEIELAIDPCRLGDFLVEKMEQLPKHIQQLVTVAACLGNDIDEKLLKLILPPDSVTVTLQEAVAKGVLVFDEQQGYSFRHEGLQHSCQALIPQDERLLFHLDLGRKLLRGLTERERNDYKYLILDQLRFGNQKINLDEEENEMIGILCLRAGQSSARKSVFKDAADYLNFGIEILEGSSWDDNYSLKLALYNAAAEMELTLSNFERVDTLLQAIFENAKNFREKLQAYTTQIYKYGITDQQHLAVETAVDVLKNLGETFPVKSCKTTLALEMFKVKRLVNRKSNAQILRMELMKSEEKVAAMQILNITFLNALIVRPRLALFIQLKAVSITMKYGLTALSSVAFACYGMLCTTVGNFDEAFRVGRLSLELVDKFSTKQYIPRVYAAVYGSIYAWKRPIAETIEPLKHASMIGSQTGDIEFSCLNANLFSTALFFSDATLPVVASEVGNIIDMMVARRQDSMLVLTKPFYQLTLNLMGQSEDPMELDAAFMTHAENTRNVTSLLCLRMQKLILFFLFGDYLGAKKMLEEMESMMNPPPPGVEYIFLVLFSGLIGSILARESRGYKRQKHLRKVRQAIRQFKGWASQTPHNCLPMKFLLEAEYASVQGNHPKAYEKFTAASAMAAGSGVRMLEAIAHERTGRHLLLRGGEEVESASTFTKASVCYQEWGAKAKVDHLTEEIRDLFSKNRIGNRAAAVDYVRHSL